MEAKRESLLWKRGSNGYDGILGISGGIDSSYRVKLVKEQGYNILLFHLESAFDSEDAQHNINRIVEETGNDYEIFEIDPNEFADLQVAYFKAGVKNLDVPADYAIVSALYNTAKKHGIKTVVSGSNYATESILPRAWGHDALDVRNLKSIYKKHGQVIPGRTYPFEYLDPATFNKIKPLNAIDYNPFTAKLEVKAKWGFRDYGLKHWENIFTKIYHILIFPERWGFDKWRAYFSSNICSGHMERGEALKRLDEMPPFKVNEVEHICKALNIETSEFYDYIHRTRRRSHLKYDFDKGLWIRAKLRRLELRLQHAKNEIFSDVSMGE